MSYLVDSGVKLKYLTSIMLCHAKAQGVVTDTQGISHSSQTGAFSWNGWTKYEQVYNEQIKPGKMGERLSTASQVLTNLSDSCLP